MNWWLLVATLLGCATPSFGRFWCDSYPWDCACSGTTNSGTLPATHYKRIGVHGSSFYRCDANTCHKTINTDFSDPNKIDWEIVERPGEELELYSVGNELSLTFELGGTIFLTSDSDGVYLSNDDGFYCKSTGVTAETAVTEIVISGEFEELTMDEYQNNPANYDEQFTTVVGEAYTLQTSGLSAVQATEGSLILTTKAFLDTQTELPAQEEIDSKVHAGFKKQLLFREATARVHDERRVLTQKKAHPKRKEILRAGDQGEFLRTAVKAYAYSALYGPPVSGLQAELDDYCNKQINSIRNRRYVARYDTGTVTQDQRMWRCYRPASLDFTVSRGDACVNACGDHTECLGVRVGPSTSHVTAPGLLEIIESRQGEAPNPQSQPIFDPAQNYTKVAEDLSLCNPENQITLRLSYSLVRTCHAEVKFSEQSAMIEVDYYRMVSGPGGDVCMMNPAVRFIDSHLSNDDISHIFLFRQFAEQQNLIASNDANDNTFIFTSPTMGARLPDPVSGLQRKMDSMCSTWKSGAVARKNNGVWNCYSLNMLEANTKGTEPKCTANCNQMVSCYGVPKTGIETYDWGPLWTEIGQNVSTLREGIMQTWLTGPPAAIARYYKYEGTHWDKGDVNMKYQLIRSCAGGSEELSGMSPMASIPYANPNYQVPIFELQHDREDPSLARVKIFVMDGTVWKHVDTVDATESLWIAHDNPTTTKAPTPYVTTLAPTKKPTEAPTKAPPPTPYQTLNFWKTDQLSALTECPSGQERSSDGVCVDIDECAGTNWRDFLLKSGCPNPYITTGLGSWLAGRTKSQVKTDANDICNNAARYGSTLSSHVNDERIVQCTSGGIRARSCDMCNYNSCNSNTCIRNPLSKTCVRRVYCSSRSDEFSYNCKACQAAHGSCYNECVRSWIPSLRSYQCNMKSHHRLTVDCGGGWRARSCFLCPTSTGSCDGQCWMSNGVCQYRGDEASNVVTSYELGFSQRINWHRAACCGNDYEVCDPVCAPGDYDSVWENTAERCDAANTGRTCVNTFGSFKCRCPEGFTYDADWDRDLGDEDENCVPKPIYWTTRIRATLLHIDLRSDLNSFDKYQVTLGQWDFNEGEVHDLVGFPRETANQQLWVSSLYPGAALRISVDPYVAGAYSADHRIHETVYLSCGCGDTQWAVSDAEKTGKPTEFRAVQRMGFIEYSWNDNSMCEAGFSFYRKDAAGVRSAFAEDYMFVAGDQCGFSFLSPTFARDDIMTAGLQLGSLYDYCVMAVGPRTLRNPYFSDPACMLVKIRWESMLNGVFTLDEAAGKIPVEGVKIDWVMIGYENSEFGRGSTTTDAQGKYQIHILGDITGDKREQVIRVNFTKTTGGVSHEFVCDGISCDRAIVHLTHLNFDSRLDIIDTTAIMFSGNVRLGNTQHPEQPKGCPFMGVEVCLRLPTGDSTGCTETDHNGFYQLPAVLGTTVTPQLVFGQQQFVSAVEQASVESGNIDPVNHYNNLKFVGCPNPTFASQELSQFDHLSSVDFNAYEDDLHDICTSVQEGTASQSVKDMCCGHDSMRNVALNRNVLSSSGDSDVEKISQDTQQYRQSNTAESPWVQVHVSHLSTPISRIKIRTGCPGFLMASEMNATENVAADPACSGLTIPFTEGMVNATTGEVLPGFKVGMSDEACVEGSLDTTCMHSNYFAECQVVTNYDNLADGTFNLLCGNNPSGKYITLLLPGADRRIVVDQIIAETVCGNIIEECGMNRNLVTGFSSTLSSESSSSSKKAATNGRLTDDSVAESTVSSDPWLTLPLVSQLDSGAAAQSVSPIHVGEVVVTGSTGPCSTLLMDTDCGAENKGQAFPGFKVGLSDAPCTPGTDCEIVQLCGQVTQMNDSGSYTVDCGKKTGKYLVIVLPGAGRQVSIQEVAVMGFGCAQRTEDFICYPGEISNIPRSTPHEATGVDIGRMVPPPEENVDTEYMKCFDDNTATYCTSGSSGSLPHKSIILDLGAETSMYAVEMVINAAMRITEFEVWLAPEEDFDSMASNRCFGGVFPSDTDEMTVLCDAEGRYLHIRVPADSVAKLSLAEIKLFREHNKGYFITDNVEFSNIDFVGVTTREIEVAAFATDCGFEMGQTVFEVSLASCPTWKKTEVIPVYSVRMQVPLQQLELFHVNTTIPGTPGDAPTAESSALKDQTEAYFSALLGPRKAIFRDMLAMENHRPRDASAPDYESALLNYENSIAVNFTYHTEPQLEMACDITDADCVNTACRNPDDGRKPIIIDEFTDVSFVIEVSEKFGHQRCDKVTGSVEVLSDIGTHPSKVEIARKKNLWPFSDEETAAQTKCNRDAACAEEITYLDSLDKSVVAITLTTGSTAQVQPYTRPVTLRMHKAPHRLVTKVVDVYVQGTYILGAHGSIAFPQGTPIMRVHDPPGGLSYAYYKTGRATLRFRLKGLKTVTSPFAAMGLGLGFQPQSLKAWTPKPVVNEDEENKISILGGIQYTQSSTQKQVQKAWGEDTLQWDIHYDMKTSDYAGMPGKQGDMFMIPIMSIGFVEVLELNYDDNCQMHATRSIQWKADASDGSDGFGWLSLWHIENVEIPLLDRMKSTSLGTLSQLQNTLPLDTAQINDVEGRIAALADARDHYTSYIDLNQKQYDWAQACHEKPSEPTEGWDPATGCDLIEGVGGDAYGEEVKREVPGPLADLLGGFGTGRKQFDTETDGVPTYLITGNEGFDQPSSARRLLAEDPYSKLAHLYRDGTVGRGEQANPNGETTDEDEISNSAKWFKFVGGGGLLEFDMELKAESDHLEQSMTAAITAQGDKLDLGINIVGIDIRGFFENQGSEGTESHSSNRTLETSSGNRGFVLGDDDLGDVFDVKIFIDSTYKSYLFYTTSGFSKCPHEPRTRMREVPLLSTRPAPAVKPDPSKPAMFVLQIGNGGLEMGQFEFYPMEHTIDSGFVPKVNGRAITSPILMENVPPLTTLDHTIVIYRDPVLAKDVYETTITYGLRTKCESNRFASKTFWNVATALSDIFPRWLTPCSTVEFYPEKPKIVFNKASEFASAVLPISVRNTNSNGQLWSDDPRLEQVVIEYRRVGNDLWRSAQNQNDVDIDFIEMIQNGEIDEPESNAILSSNWNVAVLQDGEYLLRATTKCERTLGIAQAPHGLDEWKSATLLVVIDRDEPDQFGFMEPADREYFPGDEMSVQYDEPINCQQPFEFNVRLEVEPDSYTYERDDLVILCEEKKVSVALKATVAWSVVNNQDARLKISNVHDVNGNTAKDSTVQFKFADIDQTQASVLVKNLGVIRNNFATPAGWADPGSNAHETVKANVVNSIAIPLGILFDRIHVQTMYEDPDIAGAIFITFTILPPDEFNSLDTLTAPDAATTLAGLVENPDAVATVVGGFVEGPLDYKIIPKEPDAKGVDRDACAHVEFDEAFGGEGFGGFRVNLDDSLREEHPGEVKISARNSGDHPWSFNRRLKSVTAEYRLAGDLSGAWLPALDVAGKPVELKHAERDNGLAYAWWHTANVPDGKYALRFKTVCTPEEDPYLEVLEVLEGAKSQLLASFDAGEVSEAQANTDLERMNNATNEMKQLQALRGAFNPDAGNPSQAAVMLLDRERPVQFGSVSPIDGIYRPGQKLAISFNEELDCSNKENIVATLQVGAASYTGESLMMQCSGRMVAVLPDRSFDWDAAVGQRGSLKITGVTDAAGNTNTGAVNLFDVQAVDLTQVDVMWGLTFFFDDVENNGIEDPSSAIAVHYASKIRQDLATITGASEERFLVSAFTFQEQTRNTWATVQITATGTDPTSTSLQQVINNHINALPPYDSADRHPLDEVFVMDVPRLVATSTSA